MAVTTIDKAALKTARVQLGMYDGAGDLIADSPTNSRAGELANFIERELMVDKSNTEFNNGDAVYNYLTAVLATITHV